MKSGYIFGAIGFIFLSIGVFNNDKYNTNKAHYKGRVTTMPEKNDRCIWKYEIKAPEYCHMISVSEKIKETVHPVYVGDDAIKVPVGGGTFSREKLIYLAANCNLSQAIVFDQPKIWWSYTANTTQYLDYTKMIETMGTQIPVDSPANLFIVRDGHKLATVYLYGYLDINDKFTVTAVSDDELLIIESLSYYPTYFFYVSALCTLLIAGIV